MSSNIPSQILLILYIFIDASGWVISDVSFGFTWGLGSCNIRPSSPNDQVGIDLTPTPIPAANLRIHISQMTTEMALSLLTLKQPIRAKLLWWFLIFPLKSGGHFALAFRSRWHVVIRLFVQSGMLLLFFFISFFSPFFFLYVVLSC